MDPAHRCHGGISDLMDEQTPAGRIGVIVPSSNTVAEVDFYHGVPEQVTVHTARMYLVETTADGEYAMLEVYLPRAVTDLAGARPDVVAFACTSAGALIGHEGEMRLVESIGTECG